MLLMKKSPVSVALEPIELCPRSYRSGGYYHHVWNDRGSEKTRFFFFIFAKSSAGRQTRHFGQSNGSS